MNTNLLGTVCLPLRSMGCKLSILRMVAFEWATTADFVARVELECAGGRLHRASHTPHPENERKEGLP